MDTDAYEGREQSFAKHEILKRYLEALAFKIGQADRSRPELTFNYVDGFSGPWESKTIDLSRDPQSPRSTPEIPGLDTVTVGVA